jgi:Mn2+/Fe2+ NRAMP family transporter
MSFTDIQTKAQAATALLLLVSDSAFLLCALVIQYSPISPMKALVWSAVINGVVAVPLMAVIILLASKKSVMGEYTVSLPIVILGWIATGIMAVAAIGMLITK